MLASAQEARLHRELVTMPADSLPQPAGAAPFRHYRKLSFAFGMASVALVIALLRYIAG